MTGLLLDTHVWLWALAEPQRLGAAARAALTDPSQRVVVSTVSAAEVEIKRSVGKLRVDQSCDELLMAIGGEWLALQAGHVAALRSLPLHHRDSFDRILVAQALVEGLTLVTADARLAAYDVVRLEA